MAKLRDALVDYLDKRPVLMDLADFIAAKAGLDHRSGRRVDKR